MEGSNEELCASIVAHELVIDAVKNVVEKGQLSSSDEERVLLALHPSSIEVGEIECLCQNAEDKLGAVTSPPEKLEMPALKRLVEEELNRTFDLVDRLEVACGLTRKEDQLTENDILNKVDQIHEVSSRLQPELDKLCKGSKVATQLIKESLDPIANRASALKLELLQNISEISQLESSILNEKFKNVPNDVLERLVNDLEAEVVLGDVGNAEGLEENSDLAAAPSNLKAIKEEIELKRALLEAVFSDEL